MNDTIYTKTESGRYKPIGTLYNRDVLRNGIWLIQNDGRSQTSLFWLVGHTNEIKDVVTHATLQTMQDELSLLIDGFRGKTISSGEMAMRVLRFIANKIEDENNRK